MGYAYVPINPAIPKERNSLILKASGCNVILSSSNDVKQTVESSEIVNFVQTSLSNDRDVDFEIREFGKNTNAYILFTSGTTGIPKGVPITHENLFAFVNNFESTGFQIRSDDRCLQMFDLTFDVSISSFLMPLLKGACIYTVPEGIKYIEVLKLIQLHQLTSIQIVPSVLRLGKNLVKRMKFPWVRNCILTGEATSIDLLPDLWECLQNSQIYNFYGPTESTIYCSYFHIAPSKYKNYNGMLAIGKPIGNMELVIVNENNIEVEPHEKGELMIGGDQVTLGYLNDTAKNSKSFIQLEQKGNRRFYRSGDMCYKDEMGDIYYCGRYDNQVKIQGFRIELGEIEYQVNTQFEINSIVVVIDNNQTLPELVLVLELRNPVGFDAIMDYLKVKLPEYMIPKRIEIIDEFPLGTSGKTDRRKIKEMVASEKESRQS